MAKPNFNIYRIGIKGTGKYFAEWRKFGNPRTGLYITNGGAFFRRLDTIKKHINFMVNPKGENINIEDIYVEQYTVNNSTKHVFEASDLIKERETK